MVEKTIEVEAETSIQPSGELPPPTPLKPRSYIDDTTVEVSIYKA